MELIGNVLYGITFLFVLILAILLTAKMFADIMIEIDKEPSSLLDQEIAREKKIAAAQRKHHAN